MRAVHAAQVNRLTRAINHAGSVARASSLVLESPIQSRSWRIKTLRITFLPGQARSLFIRPQALDISGARNDLLQPSPEVTGDDWVAHFNDLPFRFDPGSAVRFELRNASPRQPRWYQIEVTLEEVET